VPGVPGLARKLGTRTTRYAPFSAGFWRLVTLISNIFEQKISNMATHTFGNGRTNFVIFTPFCF